MNPNRLTFEQGLERIAKAVGSINFLSKIRTSRDKDLQPVLEKLSTDNVPESFHKWQLPFSLDRCQMFISSAGPDVRVPEHAHDADGVRIMISGSIRYGDHVLTAGDWMFVPGGKRYSFDTGPHGATMFYCYQCCCA
ncbi:MAG: hypothetical protein J5J06_15220 [Phycisphaerae bacterium]|nr:hypothetical protein [Phycisphaerae bacterium]